MPMSFFTYVHGQVLVLNWPKLIFSKDLECIEGLIPIEHKGHQVGLVVFFKKRL